MKNKLNIAFSIAIITALIVATIALADQVTNNLDVSVDANYETMALNIGGPSGSTILRIIEQNNDGKQGCNLQGSGKQLTVSISSSDTSVATVSPTLMTFSDCNDITDTTITVNPIGAGTADITLGLVSFTTNTSSVTKESFDLLPGRFTVNVNPPANSAPQISVTGVTHGALYEYGNVPVARCSIEDAEDGNLISDAILSAISGELSGHGLGIQTATCSYTDRGGITVTIEATYTIQDTTVPTITFIDRTEANSNGWNNTPVEVNWTCSDNVGVVDNSITKTINIDGKDQFVTGICTDLVGLTASDEKSGINVDQKSPIITASANISPNTNGWNNTDVTVSYTCNDDGSGVDASASSLSNDVLSASGTAEGTCVDLAGNSANASYFAKIDKDAPTASASRTPSANSFGWNNTAVTVSFSGTDGSGSGIDTCSTDVVLNSDGANQSASGTCTDKAGNVSAAATASGINIDKTVPTASASRTPAANSSGWNNTAVTVSFMGTDGSGSGIDTCSADKVLNSDGANQSASGTCTDKAGNVSVAATASGINIDLKSPIVTASVNVSPNANGWNNTDVTVSYTCTDDGSGVNVANSNLSNDVLSASGTAEGRCVDLAGNSANASYFAKIDKDAPTASASRTPSANSFGWNNTAVTVSFSGTDGSGSGIDTCSTDVVLNSDGANQTASGTCTDKAGNISAAATASGINIDLTAPSITWNGGPANGASYYYGSVPAGPTCAALDSLSGPNGCSATGYYGTVGSHMMTATAYDKAGNSQVETRTYNVMAWTDKGFYQPVDMGDVWNTVKNGSTVPLKFEIFAGATELTDITAVKSLGLKQIMCNSLPGAVEDAIETLSAAGSTILRYDSTGGQFIYNWKTPGIAGNCYQVTMTSQDGSTISAFFKLK